MATELAFHAIYSHLLTLTDYLEEAHEPDRSRRVGGRNHGGDGADGCSYCQAIKDARAAMKKYPNTVKTPNLEGL